jgi:hypothetical protein
MIKDIIKWGLIVLLILFSALFYTEIQGYMNTNGAYPVIKAFSVKSKTAAVIIFTTFNFICAILTSIITALPCGYLARRYARIIAILIIVSMQSIPAYVVFHRSIYVSFVTSVWLGQFLTGVISVFVLSEIGSRIAAKNQDNAVV